MVTQTQDLSSALLFQAPSSYFLRLPPFFQYSSLPFLLLHNSDEEAKQEIDELCSGWAPESLIPPLTEKVPEPTVLESSAGPHTTVNGKEVVNFASANYLGLIGDKKLPWGHGLATKGGFCTGIARVIDHQRLSSSGYTLSARLPPYLATGAINAIDVLEDNPELIAKLRKNIVLLWKELSQLRGLTLASHPESPIIFSQAREIDWIDKNRPSSP